MTSNISYRYVVVEMSQKNVSKKCLKKCLKKMSQKNVSKKCLNDVKYLDTSAKSTIVFHEQYDVVGMCQKVCHEVSQ